MAWSAEREPQRL